jgi:thioesterase domain-containing protein
VKIGIRRLFEFPTVAALANSLGDNRAPDHALDVLLPLRSTGVYPPLFCVHPTPCLGWHYTGLLRVLGSQYPVYALQARGLVGPEPLPETLQEMAADYIQQIRAVQPSGPYNLLGWSFGCPVVHEMATQLQDAGDHVALLAALDSEPIDIGFRVPVTERDILNAFRAFYLGVEPDSSNQNEDVSALLELIQGEGKAIGRLPGDMLTVLAKVATNNIRLLRGFKPGRFRGELLLFVAEESRSSAESLAGMWIPYIDGRIHIHRVQARHTGLMRPDALAQIGPILAERISKNNDTQPIEECTWHASLPIHSARHPSDVLRSSNAHAR